MDSSKSPRTDSRGIYGDLGNKAGGGARQKASWMAQKRPWERAEVEDDNFPPPGSGAP